jgi:uncharacterized integral membrane protein
MKENECEEKDTRMNVKYFIRIVYFIIMSVFMVFRQQNL